MRQGKEDVVEPFYGSEEEALCVFLLPKFAHDSTGMVRETSRVNVGELKKVRTFEPFPDTPSEGFEDLFKGKVFGKVIQCRFVFQDNITLEDAFAEVVDEEGEPDEAAIKAVLSWHEKEQELCQKGDRVCVLQGALPLESLITFVVFAPAFDLVHGSLSTIPNTEELLEKGMGFNDLFHNVLLLPV
jgi:hypothetical protein